MLDIRLIGEQPEQVKQALWKGLDTIDFSELLSWDEARKGKQSGLEALRTRRNEVHASVPGLKKAGADVQPVFAEMKTLGHDIKALESELAELEAKIDSFMAVLPNLPDDDVKAG